MEPDNDLRLKRVLREWQVPDAPDAVEQRVFSQPRPWWRILMTSRVRIPVPVAIVFSVALVWLAIVVVRGRVPALEPVSATHDLRGFHPVNSVGVRVERSRDATR
jgi:hypothetical protein